MPTGPDDVRFQEKTGSSRPNPISLPGGKLATLEDAARLIQRLPKAEQRRNSASALTIP